MAKILVIDDDPDVRKLMTLTLQQQGFEMDTAAHREEALTKIAMAKPALILLDVLLSGSDGRELCRELKTNEATENIPIIMLSGHPGAAFKFEAYGADDFIAKPFNIEVLLEKLNQHISS